MDRVAFLGSAEHRVPRRQDRIRAVLRLNFDLLGEYPLGAAEIVSRDEGSVGWSVVERGLASPRGPRECGRRSCSTSSRTVADRPPSLLGGRAQPGDLRDRDRDRAPDRRAGRGGAGGSGDARRDRWQGHDDVHRQRFVSTEGTTNTFGDHAWLDVLRAGADEIMTRATAAAGGGRGMKGRGDGFMLAFRSARRALTASARHPARRRRDLQRPRVADPDPGRRAHGRDPSRGG